MSTLFLNCFVGIANVLFDVAIMIIKVPSAHILRSLCSDSIKPTNFTSVLSFLNCTHKKTRTQ